MPTSCLRRAMHAFTLVEVALSLGIAAFVLAGLIGAIPLASDVGQQSVAQNRAASIASTVFTSFRAQKFGAATCLDDGSNPIDLNTQTTSSTPVICYAYFDETVTSLPTGGDQRRLHLLSQKPVSPSGNPVYQVTLRFNSNPTGTLAPYSTAAGTTRAQANAVEMSIFALARPKDVYRFSSVIANRSE